MSGRQAAHGRRRAVSRDMACLHFTLAPVKSASRAERSALAPGSVSAIRASRSDYTFCLLESLDYRHGICRVRPTANHNTASLAFWQLSLTVATHRREHRVLLESRLSRLVWDNGNVA